MPKGFLFLIVEFFDGDIYFENVQPVLRVEGDFSCGFGEQFGLKMYILSVGLFFHLEVRGSFSSTHHFSLTLGQKSTVLENEL